ncbi:MAG: B12-binding domain-containing radical SAM protein [Anaerolineales bacterium]|nr:B12-binding domain-containing radical SAM protein [Anaerolineales bacterium]
MNVLLVYPEFPDTFWSFKHALKFIRKKSASPPLGLLTIASLLPANWNLRLVDLNVRPLSKKDLGWGDMAFLSGMTVQRDSAKKIIKLFKQEGIPVVAGGPLFTMESDQFGEVDYLVLNEAEITLPEFLHDLERGKARRVYSTTDYPNLRLSPPPLWSLINPNQYDSMPLQFSRGCPFNCDFCNVTALLGHRPRTKSAEQILVELDALYKLGWRRSVFFVDDNFIGNSRYLKEELLPALARWRKGKTGFAFHTEASINLADDNELIQLMVKAGFNKVFIGIETPDNASLAECNKGQNVNRDLVEDVKHLQRSGLEVQGGFIVGFDSDNQSIFQRQIDFIQKSGIVTAMVGLLQAPPGTKLYDRLLKENRLVGGMSGDNVDGSTNIIPIMGIDKLRNGYLHLMEQIYTPSQFYQRVKTFLEEYQPPKIKTSLSWQHFLAFFRSIYHLGIVNHERRHYWDLLFWTLKERPAQFATAVTMAIYGYHFNKICKLHIF